MLEFLKVWQGKTLQNRFGVKAKVIGLTPKGTFVYLEFTEDPQANNEYPSRVGTTGQCLPTSLGKLWKQERK